MIRNMEYEDLGCALRLRSSFLATDLPNQEKPAEGNRRPACRHASGRRPDLLSDSDKKTDPVQQAGEVRMSCFWLIGFDSCRVLPMIREDGCVNGLRQAAPKRKAK